MQILLVEDEEAILKLAAITLQRAGYAVQAVHHPHDALALVMREGASFDLLITDIMMPGMNGRELAVQVRRHMPGIPCLFISGYTADLIDADGGLKAMGPLLEKPFSMKELVEAVQGVCGDQAPDGAV